MAATPGGVAAIVNRMLRIPSEAGTCGGHGVRVELVLARDHLLLVALAAGDCPEGVC